MFYDIGLKTFRASVYVINFFFFVTDKTDMVISKFLGTSNVCGQVHLGSVRGSTQALTAKLSLPQKTCRGQTI